MSSVTARSSEAFATISKLERTFPLESGSQDGHQISVASSIEYISLKEIINKFEILEKD
jgi:hypothetical protein